MIARLVTPPLVEAVTLQEAKDHLRVDHTDDDAYITRLITGARMIGEKISRRAFITQTWSARWLAWPGDLFLRLPKPPLQSIQSFSYVDASGASQTVAATDYVVDTESEPGRLWLANGRSWTNTTLRAGPSIVVRYVAGYGSTAASVPEFYRQGILLLVGHYYENREEIVLSAGVQAVNVPKTAEWLFLMNRGWY